MENNQVQLSLEKYNELLLENAKLKAAIRLKKDSWRNSVEVAIDVETIWPYIAEKFEQSKWSETHILKAPEDVYNPSITVADAKPAEPVETEEVVSDEEN